MKQLAAHDLSILGERERALAEQHVDTDEDVRFCLLGHKRQALIALDDRVVIVDAGFKSRGTSRGRAAAFEFGEIGAIEVSTGRSRGSIAIHQSALGTTKVDDFWATNDTADRFRLPNCIRVVTADLEAYEPYVTELRSLVSEAVEQAAVLADAPELNWADLAVQLQERRAGYRAERLSDASFIETALKRLSA